ncbi:zinc finger CCCH-type with G patch domain-containing protein [Cylas formicarius]|uniref:zinc finger CCCH-type with G patch domain-containing protein n=1 Tax=Cylas formicarius TaxID=197179 RepID=UPI0029584C8E|nr:zinc finger CCCH-type with G patch domain-containing protein [Cylas formicarius]
MNCEEYRQQLIQIDGILEACDDDQQKAELLSLKQNIEELLSLSAEPSNSLHHDPLDNEYSLFLAEMAKEEAAPRNPYKDIEGKKFRAPHAHRFGQTVYHNAMVCSVPSEIGNQDFEVRVLFLNPTHKEMLPCPYYFDIEKDCKFSDDKCRFSHGETVLYSSLREYVEPKFEFLTVGSWVLAKRSDNLWCRAKIKHISAGSCTIKFETQSKVEEVPLEHVFPMKSGDEESEEEDSDTETSAINRDEAIINTSLMNVPSNQALGEWEKHTKGIGSRLMRNMGYIVGAGLGRDGLGRVDPVPAIILPPGKSLDYCMKLKERRGDVNLFSADKKLKRRQRSTNFKPAQPKKDVFNVVNEALRTTSQSDGDKKERQRFRESLKVESEKKLNVTGLLLHENIIKCERAIEGYKETLGRSPEDSHVHKRLIDKITWKQDILKMLRAKSALLVQEQQTRLDRRKMTIF